MYEIRDKNKKLLAVIERIDDIHSGLHFYGNNSNYIQVGAFRYPQGKLLRNHIHIPRPRFTPKTQEIMIVLRGRCEVRIFDEQEAFVQANFLESGDFIISLNGGIGFTILENDTIMIEVKNGPYDVEDDDEERRLINDTANETTNNADGH